MYIDYVFPKCGRVEHPAYNSRRTFLRQGDCFVKKNASLLNRNETKALAQIKRRVSELFPVDQYVLFGSRARGDADADSDIDLLIVTERELSHRERHMVAGIIFEENLKNDALFSFISVDKARWSSKLYTFYPIHNTIEREGIPV
ncbi:MAG: nucleotidyltransferase domain-containing protein [Chitinivibrionales bacterium]|nr:nucleotidyltransferase domain-containing protein [Chitinivibrionales bacterium]MBD3396306.1 nucleotidyltransferase domain-containing protein [Chitinivibrionales bacterium]